MVLTHSSMDIPPALIVARIREVSVARIFAFTPLPSPSASTQMEVSSLDENTARSPQSCSPALIRLMEPTSMYS